MSEQKPKATVEAMAAHPFEVLRTVAVMAEARTAKGVYLAQVVRTNPMQTEEGRDQFDTSLIAAAKYANAMRENVVRNIEREVNSVKVSAEAMAEHLEKVNAAVSDAEKMTDKEVKTALTNGLFHSARVNLDFFWDFSTALISQERTRETVAAALNKALELQIEIFATLHQGFAAIGTEELPEWETVKERMTTEREEMMSLADEAGEECDCPNCTAERELAAQEEGQPKNGQAAPVAQTVH